MDAGGIQKIMVDDMIEKLERPIVTYRSECPNCKKKYVGAFPTSCVCGFNLDGLTWKNTSKHQKEKQEKHTELLHGNQITLGENGEFNASFDSNATVQLEDIIRFTLSFGERRSLPSPRGCYQNPIILCYIPEIIGQGVESRYCTTTIPVSGCCIISPASDIYAHPFPALNKWINNKFPNEKSTCIRCGIEVPIGEPFCTTCFGKHGGHWRDLL